MKFIHMFKLSLLSAAILIASIIPMALCHQQATAAAEVPVQMSEEIPKETVHTNKVDVAPLAHKDTNKFASPSDNATSIQTPTSTTPTPTEAEATNNTTDTTSANPVTDTTNKGEVEFDEQTVLQDKLLPDTMTIDYEWNGDVLTARKGYVYGPSGKETWYNLDMTGVIWLMEKEGIYLDYWVDEETGLKMYGDYIMCAADLSNRPRGTIVQTSLGLAMVCDFCRFAADSDPTHTHIDIATAWH